jgi:hypothetical protein
MKKVLLASAVALSILGYTQTTAQAQENKAESVRENVTIPHSSTSKIENQEKSKEKVEKTDNSSKIDDKEEKIEKKNPATEEKKSEVKKKKKLKKSKKVGRKKIITGAFTNTTNLLLTGKKSKESGTTSIKMAID